MAEQDETTGTGGLNTMAEAIGRTLGRGAAAVDQAREAHPHPVEEIKEAAAAGGQQLMDFGVAASATAGRTVARAERTVRTTRARGKKAVAKAKSRAKAVAKRGKKAVAKARARVKSVKRRGKKVVAKAKKAVARARRTAVKARKGARKK
jgi:colicin import membrane protein